MCQQGLSLATIRTLHLVLDLNLLVLLNIILQPEERQTQHITFGLKQEVKTELVQDFLYRWMALQKEASIVLQTPTGHGIAMMALQVVALFSPT